MSVNQVNISTPAKTQDQSSYSGRIIGATTGAVVGTTAGITGAYMYGGKTPNLSEVFAQKEDTFKASSEKMFKKNEEAAKIVIKAKEDVEKTEAVKKAKAAETAAQKAFDNAAKEQKVEPKYTEAVEKAQKELDETTVKIGGEEKAFSTLRDDHKKSEDVIKAVADRQENLKKAETELYDAQVKALREAAAKDTDEAKELKKVVDNFDNAKKKVEDVIKSAAENASDDVKSNYKKVSRALTEGKGKSMAIWGTVAGLVALAAGYFIGKSVDAKKNN